jgi:hypothetical protein
MTYACMYLSNVVHKYREIYINSFSVRFKNFFGYKVISVHYVLELVVTCGFRFTSVI